MLWVNTFSGFFPSLLSSSVVCPHARAGGSVSTVASSSNIFCMVLLPDQTRVLLVCHKVGTILPDRAPNVRLKIGGWDSPNSANPAHGRAGRPGRRYARPPGGGPRGDCLLLADQPRELVRRTQK